MRKVFATALAAAAVACASQEPTPPFTCASGVTAPAVVTIAWTSRPDTMLVLLTDPVAVGQACQYLETQSGAGIPSGPIAKGVGFDTDVPFHWVSDSVRFVEIAIELCDGALMTTPGAVNEFFRGATGNADSPRAPFCPWEARPVKVEEPLFAR